jgi:hypothetical protein
MSDPATIAEQRDTVLHLVNRLIGCPAGAELLLAMADPSFAATAGRCAGQFSLSAYCRQKGITHRRGTRMLERMKSAITSPTTSSPNSSPIAQQIARQFVWS